jgi:hypothetical protein
MNNFDWEVYLYNNPDLRYITNKKDAYIHWVKHGVKENRKIEFEVKPEDLEEYNQ